MTFYFFVPPVKQVTRRCLEIIGVVLGAKLANLIIESLIWNLVQLFLDWYVCGVTLYSKFASQV